MHSLCSHAFLVFIKFLSDFVLILVGSRTFETDKCLSGSFWDLSFASLQPFPVFRRL